MTQFPPIEPLTKRANRPFWSVMIPTYNGTQYLEQTLRSVLDQDPGSDQMQIEVIDDCSTQDDPEPIVKELGKGRISFLRQPQNLGQIKTWNICIERAQGQWVHILHQDDIVLPGFYQKIQTALQDHQEQVGAVVCRYVFMDENGHWQQLAPLERQSPGILENWIEAIAAEQRLQFPSTVIKRSTYEKLGGFCPEAFSASDWEMWKRVSASFQVWYEPEILACFRLHSASESSRLIKTGENITHTRCAIQISKTYLPQPKEQKLTSRAKYYYANYALKTADRLLQKRQFFAAFSQIREALACELSAKNIVKICLMLGSTGVKNIFRTNG